MQDAKSKAPPPPATPVKVKNFRWPCNARNKLLHELTICNPNPFTAAYGTVGTLWQQIADNLKSKYPRIFPRHLNGATCRKKVNDLLQKYEIKDTRLLLRSGTVEEYKLQDELLATAYKLQQTLPGFKRKKNPPPVPQAPPVSTVAKPSVAPLANPVQSAAVPAAPASVESGSESAEGRGSLEDVSRALPPELMSFLTAHLKLQQNRLELDRRRLELDEKRWEVLQAQLQASNKRPRSPPVAVPAPVVENTPVPVPVRRSSRKKRKTGIEQVVVAQVVAAPK